MGLLLASATAGRIPLALRRALALAFSLLSLSLLAPRPSQEPAADPDGAAWTTVRGTFGSRVAVHRFAASESATGNPELSELVLNPGAPPQLRTGWRLASPPPRADRGGPEIDLHLLVVSITDPSPPTQAPIAFDFPSTLSFPRITGTFPFPGPPPYVSPERYIATSWGNKLDYCLANGAACHLVKRSLCGARTPHWTKVRAAILLMEALLEAPSDADAGMPAAGKWIWAVDADAVVTNHSLRIADLLRAHGVDPLTGSLARGGRVDLVMTADCNGPNSGSVLWRASPAALLVLRAAWGAYGAGVPGLVVREGRKQGAEDGVGMDVYAGSSALAGYLHLLDEGCRPTAPEGGGIQRLLANLTLPCLRSFHSLLSSTEAPDAPRDPSVPPLPPLAAAGPQYHEQASLRHALATLLPSAYLDRALFLPQHAVNAYPAGLHAACPPFSRHPLPGLPAEGREWRRGDLLAHYPSCKHRHLGGDGWAPGEGDHVQKVLAEGHEVPRDVCGEWVEKWAAWYGKDGLEGAVGAGGRVVS